MRKRKGTATRPEGHLSPYMRRGRLVLRRGKVLRLRPNRDATAAITDDLGQVQARQAWYCQESRDHDL